MYNVLYMRPRYITTLSVNIGLIKAQGRISFRISCKMHSILKCVHPTAPCNIANAYTQYNFKFCSLDYSKRTTLWFSSHAQSLQSTASFVMSPCPSTCSSFIRIRFDFDTNISFLRTRTTGAIRRRHRKRIRCAKCGSGQQSEPTDAAVLFSGHPIAYGNPVEQDASQCPI